MQRKAIVIGATGLVGQHLIKQLSALYDTLIVIARRPPRYINNSMHFYQVNDFDNLAEVFTNIGVNKNTDAKVDYGYNVAFAELCHEKGIKNFFLLSSMNADSNSRFLYNKVKAETENAILALDFAQLMIFRPSLLLGKHKGRPLESLSQKAFQLISPLVSESLPLHPISAKRVASAMAMSAYDVYEHNKYRTETVANKTTIIENKQMLAMTRVKQ